MGCALQACAMRDVLLKSLVCLLRDYLINYYSLYVYI